MSQQLFSNNILCVLNQVKGMKCGTDLKTITCPEFSVFENRISSTDQS